MNLESRLQRSAFAARLLTLFPLILALGIFLALSAYQLRLPGLHYDEAKEAGLNAMQLLSGQPVSAFRDAAVQLGPWRLPLMVQDYIGALNVLAAIPFLAVGGVNVVALRWLPVAIGALTLVLTWRVAGRIGGAIAAGIAALLLAANPSFVFWSRQGIFVTNLAALFLMASLLSGLRWWASRRPRDLWLTALLMGAGLYSKLLFAWGIGALATLAGVAWALTRRSAAARHESQKNKASTWLIAGAFFLLPLTPLLLFNLRTSGTLTSMLGNLHRSYYGVDNSAYLANVTTRVGQMWSLLRGDHFWYLGEPFANPWAPWLALGLVGGAAVWAAARQDWQTVALAFLPVFLLVVIVAQSAFTVSDLFITHYALLLPLIPLAGGLAAGVLIGSATKRTSRGGQRADNRARHHVLRLALVGAAGLAVLWWGATDLWTTLRYHAVLGISGGYAAHSDAIYDLATYLDRSQLSAPVALDWGLDAPVRFLTRGRVNPVEVFGYTDLHAPDEGFAGRVRPFLDDPATVYVAQGAETGVFKGRVEALQAMAAERGLVLREVTHFSERNGRTLFVIYRAECPEAASSRRRQNDAESSRLRYNVVNHSGIPVSCETTGVAGSNGGQM